MANIEAIIADAGNRASEITAMATAYLQGSMGQLQSMYSDPGLSGTSFVKDPALPGPFNPATPPTLTEIQLDVSGAPDGAPSITTLPDVTEGIDAMPIFTAAAPVMLLPPRPPQVADFNDLPPEVSTELELGRPPDMGFPDMPQAPMINMPVRPGSLRQFDRAAPTIDVNFDIPAPPNLLEKIKDAPEIKDRIIPEMPQIDLPTFFAERPDAPADAPNNLNSEFSSAHNGAASSFIQALEGQLDARMEKINPEFNVQMALLEGKLHSFIVDQGTALRPEIENAIYERSKGKVSAEFRRARDGAFAEAAKRGLTLPDGAVFSAVRQARLAGADANARAAVEIAVKQAEMEQQNIQFAITTSNQLRATALQAATAYHQSLVSINGQAVDVAKMVVNNIIEMHSAAIKVYSVKLELYKADASVYETHIRAISARIDVYRAQISAVQSMVQVDVARIDAYKSSIDALQAISGVYRSQVDTLAAQASVEKLKIEAFGAEVEAYKAETQAKSSEWQGYAAAVNGEESKAKLYASQMDGFRATVDSKRAQMDGYKTQAEVQVAKLGAERLKIEGYAAKVQAFVARTQANRNEWDGYSAAIGGETARVQGFSAQAGAFAHLVNGWKAQVDANAVKINAVASGNKAQLESYSSENAAYGEKMRAEGARVSAVMQFQQQLIAAYDSANRAAVAKAESESRYYQTQVQVAIERGRMDTQVLLENSKIKLEAAKGISSASTAGGQVLASMANAALSGMNTLVSATE